MSIEASKSSPYSQRAAIKHCQTLQSLTKLCIDHINTFDSILTQEVLHRYAVICHRKGTPLSKQNQELVRVLQIIENRLLNFEPREVSRAVLDCAHLNKSLFLFMLGQPVINDIKKFYTHELVKIAQGYAFYRSTDREVIEVLSERIIEVNRQFDTREIISLCQAFSTLLRSNRGAKKNSSSHHTSKHQCELVVLLVLANQFVYKSTRCRITPREIATIAKAFAIVDLLSTPLMKTLAALVIDDTPKIWAKELANIAYSFATLQTKNKKLMLDLAEKMLSTELEWLKNKDLAFFAWSFAMLNIRHDELFDALIKEVNKRKRNMHDNSLCLFVWSCAVFDRDVLHLVNSITPLNHKGYHQLLQAFAWFGKTPSNIRTELDKPPLISPLHKELTNTLQDKGIAYRNETYIQELDIWVDFALREHDKTIIQIARPSRFTSDNKEFLGGSVFLDRILRERLGYTVIHYLGNEKWVTIEESKLTPYDISLILG